MVIINPKKRIVLFWKIGKYVFNKQETCENAIEKYANLCSYHYGMSASFSRENVRFMKLFYQFFPIYLPQMNNLNWEHYVELLKIPNLQERYFYFRLVLFCNGSVKELQSSIQNRIYKTI